jgi:nucleoside-diphosphate-sugar epimerase
VKAAGARGEIATVVLRPSTIFGPDMPNRSIFALIRTVDRGLFFFVGGRNAAANYIPVENVLDALVLCGSSAAALGREFNVSDTMPLEAFIGVIADALRKPAPRLRVPRAPLRAAALAFGAIPGWPLTGSRVDALSCRATYSSARIRSVLGYRASVTVEEALRRTVGHWRAEGCTRSRASQLE